MFNIHLLNIASVFMPYVGRPYCRVLAQGTSLEAQRQHRPEQTAEHYRRASVCGVTVNGWTSVHARATGQTPERATEDLRPLNLNFRSKTYQHNQIRHTNSTNSEGEMYTP